MLILKILTIAHCTIAHIIKSYENLKSKGRQPIQDQSSVLGADIFNYPRNNYYGRSSTIRNVFNWAQSISRVSFSVLFGG